MTFESEYCCYLHMVAAGELCCLSDNSGVCLYSGLHLIEYLLIEYFC